VVVSLKFLLDSIAWGAAIGLMSMGLTLTYLTTRVPNFAHATIGLVSSLVIVYVYDRLYGAAALSYSFYPLIIILSFLLVGVVAVVIYLSVLKPLADRGNDIISLMIATFAVDIILFSLLFIALNLFPTVNLDRALDAQISGSEPRIRVGNYLVPASTLIFPAAAVILALLFHLFLTKTKFGIAMRATIENPSLAATLGVNTNMVYTVSWFISGGLAGVAGAAIIMALSANPKYSALIIVSVFAGSIVGGLSGVYWGLVGGFIVGFSEKIVTKLVSAAVGVPLDNYERLVSLVMVIIVLLVAPRGLAGVDWARVRERLLGVKGRG